MSPSTNKLRIISEKICVPANGNIYHRNRLNKLLAKQMEQIGSSLVLGRAGTGKTTAAVEFSNKYDHAAWFRVESTDSDWNTFSQYFIASVQNSFPNFKLEKIAIFDENDPRISVLKFLEALFIALEDFSANCKCLLILDDLHNVFDVEWFDDFFNGLLSFQNPRIHILLLTRSKPPSPLWRLRSKQKLSVVDETTLLFSYTETIEYLKKEKFAGTNASEVYKTSFGRISKILEIVETPIDSELNVR